MMLKKRVSIQVDPNIPEPYLSYIRERNSNVARHIAKHLGISFDDTLTDYRTVQSYIVPSKTIQLNEAHRMGICTVDDFYGGAVRDFVSMVQKRLPQPLRQG